MVEQSEVVSDSGSVCHGFAGALGGWRDRLHAAEMGCNAAVETLA